MKSIVKLAGFLFRQRVWIFISIMLSFAAVFAAIGLLGTSAYIIALAALKPSFAAIQLAVVGVRFFGISRGVFRYLERLVSHFVNLKFLSGIRIWFFELLEKRVPFREAQFQKGDLFARVTADIETLEDLFIRIISPLAIAILTTIAISLFAGLIHPQFVPVLLAGMILGGFAMLAILAFSTRHSGARIILLRADFSQTVKDIIDGNVDIHTFGLQNLILNKLTKLNKNYYQVEKSSSSQKSLSTLFSVLVPGLTTWGILWVGTELVYQERISGVLLAVMVLVTLGAFEAIYPLATSGEVFSRIRESAERLFVIAKHDPDILEPLKPVSSKGTGLVEIQNITFRYPDTTGETLKDISFCLRPGKIVALVGPTGSGKSTIANIILRLWDFEQGNILLDGVQIQRYKTSEIRNKISIMNQSTYIFAMSIYENLRLAAPDTDAQKIWSALKIVNLDKWIEGLPEKLDTQIGQNGIFISAGQRQRLLIARMLVKNSPVMIFDEPTANLDSVTENLLWQDLQSIFTNRSVLWITHRLVKMEDMDEILFINHGCIVERGNHEELLSRDGGYSKMWNIQNRIVIDS